MCKRFIYSIFILFSAVTGVAQQQSLPLNREFNLVNDKVFNDYNATIHTSFQPLIQSFFEVEDSVNYLSDSEKKIYLSILSKSDKKPRNFVGWMRESLLESNFLVVDTDNFYLTIDPLFNFELGKDIENGTGTLYKNTRGAIVRGNIGKQVSFKTAVYENQATLPNYLVDYINETKVMPGQGRVKQFKLNGYDYSISEGYISYSPAKFINLQLGNDKHFIGDGYRSLLLSDLSYNYPYIKISTLFGKEKFQYTKLHASLINVNRIATISTPEPLYERKAMSVHYLNWLPTKWLSVGFFESTIWQTMDSAGTKPFRTEILNPIIYANTLLVGSFEDEDNSMIGLNVKIKTPYKAVLYGQLVMDGGELDTKSGFQIGAKYFGIKNLTLQAEYNNVSAYTYSSELPLQNYSHFNQPLAHPLGANFDEIVGLVNYRYKRAFTQVKVNVSNSSSVGNDIFLPENVAVPLIFATNLMIIQAHIGYLINPKNNMNITAGFTLRDEDINGISNKTNYIYFALRTSLRNLYSDF